MKRLLFIIFLATAFFSCKNKKDKGTVIVDSVNKIAVVYPNEDTLHIEYANGTKDKLVLASKEFEYLVAPDSLKIAINTRLFSNLTITEVFGLKNQKRIDHNEAINISTIVWDSIAQIHKISKADILYPKTHTLEWTRHGTALRVLVSGTIEAGGYIEEEFEIIIKD